MQRENGAAAAVLVMAAAAALIVCRYLRVAIDERPCYARVRFGGRARCCSRRAARGGLLFVWFLIRL